VYVTNYVYKITKNENDIKTKKIDCQKRNQNKTEIVDEKQIKTEMKKKL